MNTQTPKPHYTPASAYTHRRSVNFTPTASNFLTTHAEQLGISFADLVRRAVDEYRVRCGAVAGVKGKK